MYILFQAIAFASESALTDTGEYQMKLARQSTTALDRADRENTFSGKFDAKHLLRGNKHHFIIENATPAELKAIDGLLSETGFASCCDSRQNYDKGYSCGWWIAIEDVPAFKAEYKRMKGLVASRIEERKAEAVAEAIAVMTDDQVQTLANVAYNVRTELLTEHATVNSLRNPDYFTPAANPFHRGRNVLTADLWALVAQCLIIGKNETCASLHLLEKKANAEIERRHEAYEPRRVAEVIRAEFWMGNPVRQREDLELAGALARKIDRLIGNADQLPEFGRKYGLSPDDFVFVLSQTERLHPGMLAADIEAAHGEALAINYVLDAMPDGAGSLNGYVVQHAKGTFHNVSERNWTHNPLQASYFSPHDHQQGRMKQFCMNGEKIVRLGDACRSVAGQAKSPVHQPHKKE
ncbi:DUF5417 domain-containing protein [Escherichia coli]|nr:DUF5417 domain-containing protein [Escherichia coli]